jgi:hypothetical protein
MLLGRCIRLSAVDPSLAFSVGQEPTFGDGGRHAGQDSRREGWSVMEPSRAQRQAVSAPGSAARDVFGDDDDTVGLAQHGHQRCGPLTPTAVDGITAGAGRPV